MNIRRIVSINLTRREEESSLLVAESALVG